MNGITVTGRITKAPVIRSVGNTKVAKFTVADNYKVKGEQKTNWWTVEVWGEKPCEIIEQYFEKGRKVEIVGRVQQQEWDDKEGGKRVTNVIKASEFELGDSRPKNEDRDDQPALTEEPDEDDVPF